MSTERYSRNEALFGAEGQRRIAATGVTIVGLGGLGSHVAQQLAYLGVRDYRLVDFDIVTDSSMNRLIGAVDADVAAESTKTAVAERTIKAIIPNATGDPINAKVNTRGRGRDRGRRRGVWLPRSGRPAAYADRDLRDSPNRSSI